jgi:peptide/nickel transport system substrate-binding protein
MKGNRFLAVVALLTLVATVISCAAPTPQVIEKEVVVEKPVVETVVVEKEKVVEKPVVETVVVETVVTATPVPRGGDILHFRLAEDPETLDNVLTISLTASSVIHYLHDRLFYFDAEGNAAPWLAESWEVSEDQRVLTVKLREGVKFHDGTDFNADAVKFHFDRIMDEATASPVLAYLGSLQEVSALDAYTVEFKFEEPYAAFFINMSLSYGGFNSPTAVEKWGEEYGRHPVGTGPFMFEDWLAGSEITLARNPNYQQFRKDAVNQGPPLAEKIVLHVIPEDGVAQAAMETGEILVTGLNADTIARFVGDPNFNVVVDKNATNLVFLEFNYQLPPFDDPAFRKAISYAVNRQAAVNAAWNGYASVALTPLARGIPGFDPEVAENYGTPYNPEKATEMLADLGWLDSDGDGLLDKDGQPAQFLVRSYAGYNHIIRTLEVVQDNLKDIGVEIEIELSDWGAFYDSLWEADTWHMELMRWTWPDAIVMHTLFRSPGHFEKMPEDPEVDGILDKVATTMDPDLRAQYTSEAQQIVLEKALVIPILTNWAMSATQGYVEDYTLDFLSALIPGDVWLSK